MQIDEGFVEDDSNILSVCFLQWDAFSVKNTAYAKQAWNNALLAKLNKIANMSLYFIYVKLYSKLGVFYNRKL